MNLHNISFYFRSPNQFQRMSTDRNSRFVHQAIHDAENFHWSPIYGYQDVPLESLEESLLNLVTIVRGLDRYIGEAKRNCKRNDHLTWDESAAIYLYTMQTPLHSTLNRTLYTEDRNEIRPWFPYLKLFITALIKLPPLPNVTIVWRAVARDMASNFSGNQVQTWWTINSCSRNLNIIEPFIGDSGTIFAIETRYGRDIAFYSAIESEEEVILLPGTQVHLASRTFQWKGRLILISLKEW